MESTITGLGLASFGILAVVVLTSELAGALVGREALPPTLRPLASSDRQVLANATALTGRISILVLSQVVIVGVLVSGIASRDPVAETALVVEIVLSLLWTAFLLVSIRRKLRHG